MKKRTKQIDDSREVILPFQANGKQAYTTQGSIDMQPHENEELSSNIRKERFRGDVQKQVEAIMENSQRFVQATMFGIAPTKIRDLMADCETESIDQEGMETMEKWIQDTQFMAIQDGLKTVVKSQGKVLGEMTAKIEGPFRKAVEAELKRLFKK